MLTENEMTKKYKELSDDEFKRHTINIINAMMDVKVKKLQDFINSGYNPEKITNIESALVGLQLSKFIKMIAMLNNQTWEQTKDHVVSFIVETLIPTDTTPMPYDVTH